jgi:hypothetical protein
LPSFNHPDHIFNNIIKSLFIRLRRICTDYSDFITASITLTSQLAKRNYSITKIKKIFIAISQTSRNDLLPYKIKESLDLNKNILFFCNFNYNLNLNNLICNSFLDTKNEKYFLYNYNIKCINRINSNINKIFVYNFKLENYISKRSFFCNNLNCKFCKLIYRKSFILIEDLEFKLPIFSNGNCDSKDLIYIILCNKCKVFYVGETSMTVKERMYHHLYKINHLEKI